MSKCTQCIGLEFFSAEETTEAVKGLHTEWYLKAFQYDSKLITDAYCELVEKDTYFKVLDLHNAGVFIGEERVSHQGSIEETKSYTKEEILNFFSSTILWYIEKEQRKQLKESA